MKSLIRQINRIFALIIAPLREWVRMLRRDQPSVSAASKAIVTILMVPVFGILLILLRLRMAIRNPIHVEGRTADGDIFQCHPPDLIQLYIWLFGTWEPDLTHFIRSRLSTGDVFIDVGANVGYYTALASRCVGTQGKVVAIEASPVVFAALQETVLLNKACANVRAINKAAAATAGILTVYGGPQHNTGLTTTVDQRGLPIQATIEALPLDDLLQPSEIQNARLIKIDVEGGEPEVTAGMCSILKDGRNDLEILVELSPLWWRDSKKRPTDVLQPFFDAGFHAYTIENNYWPWRYLWPNDVRRPQRMHKVLAKPVKRIDVVLSRQDAEEL